MILNPHAGLNTESGWAMGFAFGFMGPNFDDRPPAVIAPELIDAFNEGRLVGQASATNGLLLMPECMAASQEVSSATEGLVIGIDALEVMGIAVDFLAKHIGRGLAGIAGLLFELIIPGPPERNPEDMSTATIQRLGDQFVLGLNGMGIDAGDLFIAVGIDMQTVGCELRFSRLFKSLDQARQSAHDMGRPHRVIAHWQLNASGSFELIEAS